MARASGSGSGSGSDFSVLVLGSDFATDAGAALLTPADRDEWHDCLPDLSEPDDFADLEELQVLRFRGTDRAGRTIVRVVGKFFPGVHNPPPPSLINQSPLYYPVFSLCVFAAVNS
jgi:hypothetical protein